MTAHAAAAVADILLERGRQIYAEGWTSEHDDAHADASMAIAAACYALTAARTSRAPSSAYWRDRLTRDVRDLWPWGEEWLKPKDARRDLVRAAALLVAEIERLDRAAHSR